MLKTSWTTLAGWRCNILEAGGVKQSSYSQTCRLRSQELVVHNEGCGLRSVGCGLRSVSRKS